MTNEELQASLAAARGESERYLTQAYAAEGNAVYQQRRAETAEAEVAQLREQRDAYRTALIQTGRNVGSLLHHDVSLNFLMRIPDEALAVVTRLKAERDSLLSQVERLIYVFMGIRRSIGLPDHDAPDVQSCMVVPAELNHYIRSLSSHPGRARRRLSNEASRTRPKERKESER